MADEIKAPQLLNINGNVPDSRFWTSRKFWFVVLISGVFLTIVLTKSMTFTNDQVLGFLEWLLGLALGTHALTDITSIITGRQKVKTDLEQTIEQGGTFLQGISPEDLGDAISVVVADSLRKYGGDSLRSSLDDAYPGDVVVDTEPPDMASGNSDDMVTPVETPLPRSTDKKE